MGRREVWELAEASFSFLSKISPNIVFPLFVHIKDINKNENVGGEKMNINITKLLEMLENYEDQQNRLFIKVVNEENEPENTPVRRICDLVLYVSALIPEMGTNNNICTVGVNYGLLEKWGVDEDTLFNDAMNNTVNVLGRKLITLNSAIGVPDEVNSPLVLMARRGDQFGAGILFAGDTMELIGNTVEKITGNGSYYVLPSSIHELIIVPERHLEDTNASLDHLKEMVEQVNSTDAVSENEFLSNNVYYYDANEKSFSIAA